MKILIACEESQAVTKEFRKLGHEAYSCDIEECSGGHPEWHLKTDVTELLKIKWDMILAFPPCTHLAVSGARHFESKRNDGRQEAAIEFFVKILNADCEKIVVENPVNIISGDYIKRYYPGLCEKYNLPIKPTQYIQPYEHGDSVTKKTGLWIKGLPKLRPTNVVDKGEIVTFKSGKRMHSFFAKSYGDGASRSKTFLGIAKAMAEQWGGQ
jgi:site-specific DNA-cytosine methylase